MPYEPESAAPQDQEATVRTAPKFLPFMAAGALLGLLVGLVVTLSGSGDADYTGASLFGYFGLLFGLLGLGLGAGVAVILDASSRKRAYRARLVRSENSPSER